jgi:hypothetical protein
VNLAANLGRATTLKINEWLANPSGNDNDYFELYNSEPQPVELSGLYLTDTLTKWNMHSIPPLSFLGVGEQGFARLVADGNAGQGANHVNFGLAAGGEAIGLFTSNGQGIDAVSFGPQRNGVSEGRFPDGSATITQFPGTPTPGESNMRRLKDIVINEVLTHSDPPWEDAIELYNTSFSAIDMSGWWLTDQRTDPRKFRIPEGTLLPALGYVVFYEYQINPRPGLYPSFALSSAKGDEVYLYTADGAGNLTGYRAGAQFGAAENGIPLGRYETSVGVDFTALARPTFGVEAPAGTNEFRAGTGAANSGPFISPVVINEIMYHPPMRGTNAGGEFEFVELKNSSAQMVPLYDPNAPTNTWRLRDAVDFEFPTGLALEPGGWLLVVSFDPAQDAAALAEFRGHYGLSSAVVILGPYRGRLANGTENLELYKPDAPVPAGDPDAGYVPYVLADRVKYSDADPWPSAADGNSNTNSVGVSLQRRDATQYGNDPVNWLAGIPTPGADSNPGFAELPMITQPPQDASDLVGASVSFSVVAGGAEPLQYQWRGNGADLAGATNAVLSLSNVQLEQSGSYAVRVANAAGTALSAPANLIVRFPPRITQPPQDRAAALGGFVRFMVVAEGALPLTYQWRFDGQDLANATGAMLLLTNVQPENEGEYLVVIGNSFGSVTSAPALLVISAMPMVLTEPQSANAFVGSNAVFQVGVVGAEPLFYQWRFNNVDLPDATNATLVIARAQFTNSGAYRVLVTNEVGAVLSEEALLVVSQPSVLSVAATEAAAAESGPTRGVFTISRTGNLAPELAVYFTMGGTAEAENDYALPASPVTLPAGAGSTQILVLPVDDAVAEPLETVVLTLADRPEYALGGSSSATLTIADNDNLLPSVALTAPADGTRFPVGSKIQLSATASDADGAVASVEFYADGVKLGEAGFEPFELTWGNPGLGAHVLSAIATDNLGARAVSAPVTLSLYSLGFSDLFASRGVLAGYTNTVRGTNKTYTREVGEPYHTYNGNGKGTHSAWLTWTAPETGPVTMDTLGSSFDTVLVVYTNRPPTFQTVSNLMKVASNDDADGSTFQSRVTFTAVEGTAYQIAVDGYASTNYGTIGFHLGQPRLRPEITLDLTNLVASPGEDISLTIGATGGGALSYQWSWNGAALAGETNATLLRPSVRHTHAGVYAVTVSNGSGAASSQAELIVRPVVAGVAWTPNVAALRILGTPGKPYTVLVTTNLVDWAEVGTVNSATVETQWLDQGAPAAPARAYRLRWP